MTHADEPQPGTGSGPASGPVSGPGLGRGRGWLRWLLILSLALNLAIAGIVAGAVVSGRRDGPPRGFDLAIGPLARALDREDRRWIMRELASDGGMHPPSPAARRAEAAGILAAVSAEPFDRDALAAVLDEMRAGGETMQRAAQAALLSRIAAMTPEARAAFATRLAEEFDSRGHGAP